MQRSRGYAAWLLIAALAGAQTPKDQGNEIDAIAQRHLKSGFAVGFVVGTLVDGKTWAQGYGKVAKDADAVPNASTVYEIGSISKVFTGILLADAVGRGEVALTDPVQKHLPERVTLPSKDDTAIRLVDLATHTSGLARMPLNWKPASFRNPFADYTVVRLYEGLPKTKLFSMPGTKYAYSNYAFGLLGHVLARKAGAKDYDALLKSRITGPLGLKETRCVLNAAMKERFAPAYDQNGRPRQAWDFDALAGCGAIRSTTAELLAFARANLNPDDTKLAAALRLAQQHHRKDPKKGPTVGLGWHFDKTGKQPWHNGGTGGFRTFLGIDPERRCAVVVLANTTSNRVNRLAREILAAL